MEDTGVARNGWRTEGNMHVSYIGRIPQTQVGRDKYDVGRIVGTIQAEASLSVCAGLAVDTFVDADGELSTVLPFDDEKDNRSKSVRIRPLQGRNRRRARSGLALPPDVNALYHLPFAEMKDPGDFLVQS